MSYTQQALAADLGIAKLWSNTGQGAFKQVVSALVLAVILGDCTSASGQSYSQAWSCQHSRDFQGCIEEAV